MAEVAAAVDYLAGRPALMVLLSVAAIVVMVVAAPLLAPASSANR